MWKIIVGADIIRSSILRRKMDLSTGKWYFGENSWNFHRADDIRPYVFYLTILRVFAIMREKE